LNGDEKFTLSDIAGIKALKPILTVTANHPDGSRKEFQVTARIDTPLEMAYFKAGGLMRKVMDDQ
jgi:aconitate hydratase